MGKLVGRCPMCLCKDWPSDGSFCCSLELEGCGIIFWGILNLQWVASCLVDGEVWVWSDIGACTSREKTSFVMFISPSFGLFGERGTRVFLGAVALLLVELEITGPYPE